MRAVRTPRIAWLWLALAAGFPPGVAGAEQTPVAPRVLVMPFTVTVEAGAPGGAGTALWLGEAASILLSEQLTSSGNPALTRDERLVVFSKLNLPMSASLTRATMIRVGEIIGASDIVIGDVRLSDRLHVRARVVRLATGQEMPTVSDEGDLGAIVDLFARVASKVGALTGRAPAPRAGAGAPALPLEVFENYVKGLVATTPAAQQRFLELARRQVSNDPSILLALWNVYTAQSAHDKALAVASAVSDASPRAPEARLAMGLSLIALRRFDGAYKTLTALDGSAPRAAVANALGVVQLRRGAVPPGTPSAASCFRRAVDAAPEDTQFLFNLGYAQALAGNSAEALTWLREVVRFDSADTDAHIVMSAVLSATGRSVEAQRELDLARLLDSESASRVTTGRVPPGLERILNVLTAFPAGLSAAIANPAQRDQRETALFHLSTARTFISQQRDRDATNELRRAIYLAPYEDEPHLLLGQVYGRSGQLTQAIDEFTVAIWCRETAAARIALAGALLERGDRASARREAQRALVLAPESTEAQALLARIGG